jgi:hypothetical protein
MKFSISSVSRSPAPLPSREAFQFGVHGGTGFVRNNEQVRAVPLPKESFPMATNNPRHGYERKRSQLKTKTMGQKHWTKRSRKTGEFMDQKKAGKFKSVRREKSA